MPQNPRKKAVTMLMDIEKNSAYINIEMNKLRSSGEYSGVDIRFIGELVNGVTKRRLTLDYVISKHSKVRLNKIAPYVLAVLRSGVYQIIYMSKVPASAAVNESVKLIKKSSVARLSSFVNAVLRAVSSDDIADIDTATRHGLSLMYSFPLWIVERWHNRYGYEFTMQLLEHMNMKPSLFVRRNVNIPLENLLKKLNADLVSASKFTLNGFPDFDYSIKIDTAGELSSISSFNDGDFYIQDPAAAFAAYIMEPKSGDTIIDMCAAPGGKSLFMAELMKNQGKVTAFDIYEHKLELIKNNCNKYGISIVLPTLQDASCVNPDYVGTADKILCDVPCSGLGIIRKKPDIRYSRCEEDITQLANLSMSILENAALYLKPGGTLVFSTCTIEPEENENVVMQFLASHSEFSYFPFCDDISYKTFYPNVDGTDGFFVCRLIKNGEAL